jgi:hypothetical protein
MENKSNNAQNTGRTAKPANRLAPKNKRWTLLYIGNRGRTITLKRFKGMVLLNFLALGVAIAVIVGLLFFSLDIRQDKIQLESNLKALKEQVKTLRYEKDILMTRLVLAESRLPEGPAKIPEKKPVSVPTPTPTPTPAPASTPTPTPAPAPTPALASAPDDADDDKNDVGETRPAIAGPVEEAVVPDQKQNEPQPQGNPSDSGLSVVIENFKVSPDPGENLLRVQFKIKNTSPNSQRVSGHAIVVVKGGKILPEHWVTIPAMRLVDGKPSGRQRGHAFGINYFKTMRFKTALPKYPEEYQSATVYIYGLQGELLLEQDFAVEMPAAPRNAATPSQPPPSTPTGIQDATPSTAPPSADEVMNTLNNSTSQ